MSNTTHEFQTIAEALRTVFPQLGPVEPLRVLGEGFRSLVVETADGIVFRIAKNQAAAEGYAKERSLLPAIHSYVPIAVPDPQWYAGTSVHFPFGIIGYRKLPGHLLLPALLVHPGIAHIATDIAAFLLALHRIPLGPLKLLLPSLGVDQFVVQRDATLPALRQALTTTEYRAITAWWDAVLTDPFMHDYTPAVQHGDLWYENMLVDQAVHRVVGVVDWEQAAIGDPARDFATQLHLGKVFPVQVIATYRALGGMLNASFQHRLMRWWELREFDGLAFAVEQADHAEFEDALQKLRGGPIFNQSARLY